MPFNVTWKKKFVLFEYFGDVSSSELIESNQDVYGDQRFDDLNWELVYFDKADSVELDERTIQFIAYMDLAASRSNPDIIVAFVGQTEVLDKIETLYSNIGKDPVWPVIRFDSCEEAIAYITQSEHP
ncbi:hypothetical protein [Pelagicoccus mobilis]|uniref:Uncharacterized protein n=1 Tax=Pelagicoccus mobilis TaxID=415221 RepID=A0A934S140_9BACT|nr:hypothetical protein [Pelagicoccus mobilis]MBK1880421.1 hypothetical protein [Pelagicoccus mobilis]